MFEITSRFLELYGFATDAVVVLVRSCELRGRAVTSRPPGSKREIEPGRDESCGCPKPRRPGGFAYSPRCRAHPVHQSGTAGAEPNGDRCGPCRPIQSLGRRLAVFSAGSQRWK